MRLGTDKKGQLYMLIGLLAVLFGYGGYQMYKTFGGGSSYTPPPPAVPQYRATPGSTAPAGPEAQKLSNTGLDPTLSWSAWPSTNPLYIPVRAATSSLPNPRP